MSTIEAELIGSTSFTGHEICESKFSYFIQSKKSEAVKIAREIQTRYLFPGESITVSRAHRLDPSSVSRHRGFEVFDVFSIPLPSDHFGYAQFLGHIDEMQADAVRVFKTVTHGNIADLKGCISHGDLFPPVLTLMKVAIKTFGWKRIGNVLSESQVLQFRHSTSASLVGPGVFHDWRLWTSTTGWMDVGDLPEAHRNTEMSSVWSPWAIADRIVTGRHIEEGCL